MLQYSYELVKMEKFKAALDKAKDFDEDIKRKLEAQNNSLKESSNGD